MSQFCADLEWAPDWLGDFEVWDSGWWCLTCWENHLEDASITSYILHDVRGMKLPEVLKILEEHVENEHC